MDYLIVFSLISHFRFKKKAERVRVNKQFVYSQCLVNGKTGTLDHHPSVHQSIPGCNKSGMGQNDVYVWSLGVRQIEISNSIDIQAWEEHLSGKTVCPIFLFFSLKWSKAKSQRRMKGLTVWYASTQQQWVKGLMVLGYHGHQQNKTI